jgi:hypothetical protein
MIQIDEHKYDKMSEYAEKMLKYGGKLMSCIEEMGEEHGYGHRGGYGNRYDDEYSSRYGMGSYGMGYRDDEDEWDDEKMNERRGGRRRRDSMGRYR